MQENVSAETARCTRQKDDILSIVRVQELRGS